MKDINYYKIIIGAYLHDMGKLLWRGGFSRKKPHTHQISHAQYVYDYFSDPKYSKLLKQISLLSSLHHYNDFVYNKLSLNLDKENRDLAWIIYMGDNLGSQERQEKENKTQDEKLIDELNENNDEYESIKKIGLSSIFQNIFKTDSNWSNIYSYLPSTIENINFVDKGHNIENDEFLKGRQLALSNDQIKQGFETLANNFKNELENFLENYKDIDENNIFEKGDSMISQLDILTQKYFSLVPSDAYTSIGDISLYDHTKLVVANSILLYKIFSTKNINYKIGTKYIAQNDCLLIAGDFPSIQKYISQAMSSGKNLAKRLRARSFIVQILTETVIEYILKNLGLPRANVLINSGGKFVILTDIKDQKKLNSLKENINNFLIKKYGSDIRINLISQVYKIGEVFDLDYIDEEETKQIESGKIKKEDIKTGGVKTKNVFGELFKRLTENKHQIYSKSNLKNIFSQAHFEGKNIKDIGDISEGEEFENIKDEKLLGENIVKLEEDEKYIFLNFFDSENNFAFSFSQNGKLLTKGNLKIQLNDWDIKNENQICIAKSINLYVPKVDRGVKPFDKIIKENSYLCMLKGDVDNMSLILKYGFGEIEKADEKGQIISKNLYSISRLVQFSRYLELFFGKITNDILKKDFENIYTVFSGGDDFVFILPFEDRKEFLKSYQKSFKKFVSNNPRLHFSTGLSIFKNKTPFKFVDGETENLLNTAKKNSKSNFDIASYENMPFELTKYSSNFYEKDFILPFDENEGFEDQLELDWGKDETGEKKSSWKYGVYQQLQTMKMNAKDGNWADYIVGLSKIYYSLARNITNLEQKNIILNSLKTLDISQNDIEKNINILLLKLVDGMYESRTNN